MSKIDFKKLNSANVSADNSVDMERVYDIHANVNIVDSNVNSIEGGIVKKGEVQVATFSKGGEKQLYINFDGAEAIEMCDIINAINEFYSNVSEKVTLEKIEI